jgi:HAD superfamily hydrolase (TIGR01549 family)
MDIFFDIDDTLVDSESAHCFALKKIISDFLPLTGEFENSIEQVWFEITEKYLELYFAQKISLEQQRISRIKKLWENLGTIVTDDQARKIYDRYHHYFLHSCLPFPDTIPCLLKMQKHRLGIISNGTTDDQIFKLKHNNLFHFFNTVLISEKAGVVKPDKEIFRQAAIASGTDVSECIYIGNSYNTDYLGSLKSGMRALWLDRKYSHEHSGSEMINTLQELVNHPLLRKEE